MASAQARLIIGRYLPYFNFVVATSALTFQVKVLYPWHLELDDSFQHVTEKSSKRFDNLETRLEVVDPKEMTREFTHLQQEAKQKLERLDHIDQQICDLLKKMEANDQQHEQDANQAYLLQHGLGDKQQAYDRRQWTALQNLVRSRTQLVVEPVPLPQQLAHHHA